MVLPRQLSVDSLPVTARLSDVSLDVASLSVIRQYLFTRAQYVDQSYGHRRSSNCVVSGGVNWLLADAGRPARRAALSSVYIALTKLNGSGSEVQLSERCKRGFTPIALLHTAGCQVLETSDGRRSTVDNIWTSPPWASVVKNKPTTVACLSWNSTTPDSILEELRALPRLSIAVF